MDTKFNVAPGAQMMTASVAPAPHIATVDTSSQCVCCTSGLATCLFCCTGMVCIAPWSACKVIPPRVAAVGLVYGQVCVPGVLVATFSLVAYRSFIQYIGTWTSPGLVCVNPCGLTWLQVSVNNRAYGAFRRRTPMGVCSPHADIPPLPHVELKAMKCADSAGNSILVSGVITYRICDAARAVLDMGNNLDEYVHLQGQAVLKRVVSQYRYITYDGSPSLLTEQSHLGDQLRGQMQEQCSVSGVEIISFMLSDLAYAPEIASQMLVRQQAQAMVDARKTIVSGAVSIACDALDELAQRGKKVTETDASKFLTNLVLVVTGEKAPTPVIDL
jgi:regulator of protease activity HflC (stomatin/prohibitin superfamily)